MKSTPTRRRSIPAFLVLVLLLTTTSCRSVAPEAGLDQQLFETPAASLSIDPRGFWFAVAPAQAPITDYVLVEHDGQTEAFYAVPHGERAAQLLPLTPTEGNWFAEAVSDGATPEFVGTLEGSDVSDTLGMWSGAADEPVRWLGPAPTGETTAVALPAASPRTARPFYESAQGIARVDDTSASTLAGDLNAAGGPYLLLPDGRPSGDQLRVVDLTEQQTDLTVDEPSEYIALPTGRRLGADVLLFGVGSGLFISNIGPDQAVLPGDARLVAAIAEGPVEIRDKEAVDDVVRGFEALREGRVLAASYWLRPELLAVEGNGEAARLRVAELPGAAGLGQWARVATIADSEGVGADHALYLARVSLLGGQYAVAGSYGMRSESSFERWPEPTKFTGAARAQLLSARSKALRDELEPAIELAREAVRNFESVRDELRQADAETELAGYLYTAGRLDEAIETMQIARSRYYHGGSAYFSALAEIDLAGLLLEAGRVDEAVGMATDAEWRMEKFDEPVGLNRAQIVAALTGYRAGDTRELAGRLENALDRAEDLSDPTGRAMAAATLVRHVGVDDTDRIVELGALLINASAHISDPFVARRVERAVASLCGQGLVRYAEAADRAAVGDVPVASACERTLLKVAGDPATLQNWMTRGYSALQKGQLDQARAIADELEASLERGLRESSPVTAAQVLLFRHAVLVARLDGADKQQKEELLEEAVELLERGVDPARVGERFGELARTFRARGLTDTAALLGHKAMDAARDNKDYETERELLFFLLDTYQEADDWDALVKLARDGDKIVSRAGPGSDPMRARVLIYQSDAEYRLGRRTDAGLHRSNALSIANQADDDVRLGLLVLAAELDLDRGAPQGAEPMIVAGLKIENALSDEQRQEPDIAADFAQLHVLHGELGVILDRPEDAREAFDAALGYVDEGAFETRARAYVGRATISDDTDDIEEAERGLAEVLDEASSFVEPIDARNAHRVAVEYMVDASHAEDAAMHAEEVHRAGFALAPSQVAPCIAGRAELFGGDDARGLQQLSACAEANDNSLDGELAALLVALHDESVSPTRMAKRAEAIQGDFEDELSTRQAARLDLIYGLSLPDREHDDDLENELFERAAEENSAEAVAAYADYLLSVNRLQAAETYIDENSSAFYARGQESPGTLIRLRLEAMIRQLDPRAAARYAERAVSEARQISNDEQAHIDLLRATNEVVLGRWRRAQRLLRGAATMAENDELIAEVEAFTNQLE